MWTRSDGAGGPQKLLDSPNNVVPWSFSPDGRRLAYFEVNPDTGYDIWTLPLGTADNSPKPGKPEPFLRTPADELAPVFSPDGRWIAYRSNESGASEIYVRPAPKDAAGGALAGGGKWPISSGGGLFPFWAKNGPELFYEATDNRIMVVDYTVSGDSFVPGKPRLWSEKQIFDPGRSSLDLAPDGKRFAVFPMPESTEPGKGSVHVTFLLNFLDELKRKMP
jgi:serine/threonine-protein kinase